MNSFLIRVTSLTLLCMVMCMADIQSLAGWTAPGGSPLNQGVANIQAPSSFYSNSSLPTFYFRRWGQYGTCLYSTISSYIQNNEVLINSNQSQNTLFVSPGITLLGSIFSMNVIKDNPTPTSSSIIAALNGNQGAAYYNGSNVCFESYSSWGYPATNNCMMLPYYVLHWLDILLLLEIPLSPFAVLVVFLL